MNKPRHERKKNLLAIIGPGLLVAATGVGAGDLATASLAGIKVGTAVLWAVLVGACLKFVLNEGLTRWQLATGSTLLEGANDHLGAAVTWIFLPYFLIWSFLVSLALMSACGVTLHAMVPVFEEASHAKIVFGILHSAIGVALVLAGGYALFERVMGVCIAVMFVTVVITAACLWPGTLEIARSLLYPDPETLRGDSLGWTIALMGGVGGTVTVLCYGYWIREEGRHGREALRTCRLDLGVGYAMTAIFGIAMVIIASTVELEGRGAGLLVKLSGELEETLGPTFKWLFLIGAWGAVFSSLLGVWQAVPYLFADLCRVKQRRSGADGSAVDTRSRAYRVYLFAIAIVPAVALGIPFSSVQKFYAAWGAFFIPLLALALLILNGRRKLVGEKLRNRWPVAILLIATLVFFASLLARSIGGFIDSL